MILHGSEQAITTPNATLYNITLGSAIWKIENVNTHITSCNVSKATFYLTSNRITHKMSPLSVVITKCYLGRLIIGKHFTASIYSSQTIGQEGHTAITITESSLYMYNSNFTGNNVPTAPSILYANGSSHVLIKQCTFKNNTGYYGAVFVNDSCHISVLDSVFESNVAPYDMESPGTLTVRLNSYATVVRSNFSHNQAHDGAALTILHHSHAGVEESVFNGNQACKGGAIVLAFESDAQVQHSVFNANIAVNLHSERIHSFDDLNLTEKSIQHFKVPRLDKLTMVESILNMENNTFSNNTSVGDGPAGGAVFISSNSVMKIKLSYFLLNKAIETGAVRAVYNSKLDIENSTFLRNSAKQYAGAVGVILTSSVVMRNCIFLKNYAQQHAALVAQHSVSAVLINCSFDKNTVEVWNAALTINLNSTIQMEKCIFQHSRSIHCTVNIQDFSKGNITSTKFINNTADLGMLFYIRYFDPHKIYPLSMKCTCISSHTKFIWHIGGITSMCPGLSISNSLGNSFGIMKFIGKRSVFRVFLRGCKSHKKVTI